MRKLVVFTVFAIISMLFVGCGNKEFYTVLIKNESLLKTVSYEYDRNSDTLTPNQSKTYEVKAYTQPPKSIVDQNGIASLKMERNGDHITFADETSLDLNVINMLPVDITIKADNYIDNNGSTELKIESNDESTLAKIYTKSPKFTSTTNYPTNYPIIVEYTIVGNGMSVIIR